MKYKIEMAGISKIYKIYNKPVDRVFEAIFPSKNQRYSNFIALNNIDFKVRTGEILGIIGKNGAGKSTLLKIISGVVTPSSGVLRVNGRISSLLELGAGFNPEYTGMENIYFYGSIMGFSRKEMSQRVDAILNFAEIGEHIYQPVRTYSSGMFARLAFSCAINIDPDILIVDEILSVGDMRFQAKCFNKFKEFKDKGVTILYVGHDVGLMRSFCDKCLWLDSGKIVDYGDPAKITAKYVEYMYFDDSKQESSEKQKKELLPDQFLNHWGSHKGTILKTELLDSNGNEVTIVDPFDYITVYISLNVNWLHSFDISNLAVSCSIKNKEGTDIIVKTTFEEGLLFKSPGEYKIGFKMVPCLANGDYYLAIGVEDRSQSTISYYEYIEGAIYFKCFTEKKVFGLFDPKAEILMEGIE